MMEMKEQTGSRKKYLAPVVVLMLCLVTLTGAAYAYSSIMTYTANTVQEDYISIDLANAGANNTADIVVPATTNLAFTDDFVYEDNPIVKKDTVTCYITSTKITYNLKITGDVACTTLNVSSSNIAGFLATQIGGGKVMSDLVGVRVGLSADGTGAVDLDSNSTVIPLTVAKPATDAPYVVPPVYIFIDAVAANVVIQNAAATTDEGYVTAQNCYNNANASFSLKFEAVAA